MMDKEKLIEEAAQAIWMVRYGTRVGWTEAPEDWRTRIAPQTEDEIQREAEAALAVFEKAHTPTDNEQEALARTIYLWDVAESVSSTAWEDLLDTQRDVWLEGADFVIAAGFRRSEVPEPSAEGPAFIAIMPSSPETSKRWYSMYCRECGVEEMMAETADDPRLIERRDAHNRVIHPQGEPSDADLDAARAEIAARMNYKVEPTRDAMRAALRAANEVR